MGSLMLTVRDETLDGRGAHEWPLPVSAGRMTVRDLIRDRVECEVRDYNTRHPHRYRGLVQPAIEDRGSDRLSLRRELRTVDWQKQFELAVEAFSAGKLVILIGDEQVDSLDHEFDVRSGLPVTFLCLKHLVGG